MTPEAIKAIFDAYAVVFMLAWGTLCKYLPWLKGISNSTIGWVNLVGYILSQLIVNTAHAATEQPTVSTASILVSGVVNSGLAYVIYETLLRHLYGWLKMKKA